MATVSFDRVSVSIGDTVAVAGLDLHVDDGEVLAVVGPSGAGKSSVLRAMAGIATVSSGRLVIGGVDVPARPPSARDVSMVFQEPALLPRRTGRANLELPLELRRETLESMRQRVDAEARAMRIEHLLEAWPSTMSVGEAQLVQIARALVRVPSVLLLDEPFAALDESRRRSLRSEIRSLQDGYGVTTVIATNDPDDAMELADRVVALEPGEAGEPGRMVQVGPVGEVRDEPASRHVAAALGDLWTISATVRDDGDGVWLVAERDPTFRLRSWSPAVAAHVGAEVIVGLRSDAVVPLRTAAHPATVRRVIGGTEPSAVLDVAGHLVVTTRVDRLDGAGRGDTIRVAFDRPMVFDAAGDRLA